MDIKETVADAEKTAPDKTKDTETPKNRVKKYNLLIIACFFVYGCSIAAKSVFVSEIIAVQSAFNVSKVQASLANTYYFMTYAALQVGLAFFIGRINVKKYLAFTLPVSAAICIAIPFLSGIESVWALFAVNGLAQAGVWSGCILILSKYLPFSFISKASKLMTLAMVVGCTFANAVAAAVMAMDFWQLGFYVIGVLFLCSIAFFTIVVASFKGQGVNTEHGDAKPQSEETPQFTLSSKKETFVFYFYSCVVASLSCALYYAVYNWLSNYFKDIWNMPDVFAVLITVVFPAVMSVGSIVGLFYFDKKQDFVKGEIIFLTVPLAVSVVMSFAVGFNLVFSIIMLVTYCITIKAVAVMYSNAAAFNMRTQLNSGTYSAITNAFASVSAGVVPTVIGAIIEKYGYAAQFIAVAIIAGVLMVFLTAFYLLTKKKSNIK